MNDEKPIAIFGVKRKSLELRRESQSGGAFSVIAEHFLRNGAIVYGCGFNDNLDVVYIRVDNIDDLKKIKGSKYVRAYLHDTFERVLQDLRNGRTVLFSGSACNIAGLKKLAYTVLGKEKAQKLYTVDFICHGTPSQEIYKEYCDFIEKKYKKKISAFDFRKRFEGGWGIHMENIKFSDGTEIDSRVYTDLFYSNFVLRPTCAECRYTSWTRSSDFTVADFWGVEKYHPEFYDKEGVSLLFCNTNRSLEIFEQISGEIDIVSSNRQECKQPNLSRSSIFPKHRKAFWKYLHKNGFEAALKRYTNYGGKVVEIKRKILRRLGQW